MCWLVQRLVNFQQLHPEWEIRLGTTRELVDLTQRDIDMGIRYGDGAYAGLSAHRLGQEQVFPVCSPALMQSPHPIREPNDLRWHALIHEEWSMPLEQAWPSWKMRLKAAGADQVDPDPGTRFTSSNLAIEAAIAGQGVASSSTALVSNDIEHGLLVKPFEEKHSTPLQLAYYVVYRPELEFEPKVVAFRDWILARYGTTQT